MKRCIAIGLDGYEPSIEAQLIARGELPFIASLRTRGARCLLDHGAAQRTGLAWEHVATGLAPADAQRWAAVSFDPLSYDAWQEGTSRTPFAAALEERVVVFDSPYLDLARAPRVRGVTGWGAHDPGVGPASRPWWLNAELRARFGSYPAEDWIYGTAWPSPERAREMGEQLARAVDVRRRAARWLLGDRLRDWDLALVVVSEPHSAIEGLWHGVDPAHPLHHLPSAKPAGDGIHAVYRAVDRLVAELAEAFEDATLVVFSMHGMGPNHSDAPSMALLPELLHRHAFGRPLMQQPASWDANPEQLPPLGQDCDWAREMSALFESATGPAIDRRLGPRLIRRLGRMLPRPRPRNRLHWMPATRYRPYWPRMRAFALPSFYDGRVRLNLIGREGLGCVPVADYEATLDEIEALLAECVDPRSGQGAVAYCERPAGERDPRTLSPSEADLVVVWRGSQALEHPHLGRVGPVPYRRTGGHTGTHGMAYLCGPAFEPGADLGIRSAFDIVPTLIELTGGARPARLSGASVV